jgi:hypothetical protein
MTDTPSCPICKTSEVTAIRPASLIPAENQIAVIAYRCKNGHTFLPPVHKREAAA